MIIGSARSDENKKLVGGTAGDQRQTQNRDTTGEVSLQNFYIHKKGWYIYRPKDADKANKLASAMIKACGNICIGYSQSDRYGIIKYGIDTDTPCNCDCSSLVRACIIYVYCIDVGDFNTANEGGVLEKSGLFLDKIKYNKDIVLYNGDILVTCTKGHTAIIVEGRSRQISTEKKTNVTDYIEYYPQYKGASYSIVDVLKTLGETDTSFTHRKQIALANGFLIYLGTASENTKLIKLAKQGALIKP